MPPRLLPALLAGLLAACAAGPGEKGGLVRVKTDRGALDRAHGGRRFALVIGVSQFEDEGWRDLRFADKDALDLGAALADPARGGFDSVTVLTGPERTRRETILEAISTLAAQATRPEDVVVVYVSSHGTLARDARGELTRYLVTSDASLRAVPSTAVAMDELKRAVDRVPSRRRLLILATCHSGSGKSLLPDDVQRELATLKSDGFFVEPLEQVSRGDVVLSASDWGEAAREDDSLQNDIYTHFLIEALDGRGDRNGDGAVSATEAHDHARRATYAFTQGRQRPSAEIREVGADPILLAGRITGPGNPELFSYAPRLEGFTLKVNGAPVAELPGGASVPPGKHRIELTKGGALLATRELQLAPGERLDLDRIVIPPGARGAVFLHGGALSFVDRESRAELLPATWMAGAAVRYDVLPLEHASLWVDAAASGGAQRLSFAGAGTVPFHYVAISAGASLPYAWDFGPLSLYTGPRIAALWLSRRFDLEAYAATQQYFTVTPGWMAGVSLRLPNRLELSAQSQLVLSYVRVDGQGKLLGFGGASLLGGYRF